MCQASGNDYISTQKALGQTQPFSTREENIEQWGTIPGVTKQPELPQEYIGNFSRRSRNNQEQIKTHLNSITRLVGKLQNKKK